MFLLLLNWHFLLRWKQFVLFVTDCLERKYKDNYSIFRLYGVVFLYQPLLASPDLMYLKIEINRSWVILISQNIWELRKFIIFKCTRGLNIIFINCHKICIGSIRSLVLRNIFHYFCQDMNHHWIHNKHSLQQKSQRYTDVGGPLYEMYWVYN